MKKLLAWGIIIMSGILVFAPSFATSLYGDEWKSIWLARQGLEINGTYIQLSENAYTFANSTLNILTKFFPFYSGNYYLFAYLVRLIASIAIFIFVKKITQNVKSAFISAFLFLVTPIGLESYIWLKNFDSLISIILFFTIYLVGLKDKIQPLKITIGFILILLFNTIRVPGVFLILNLFLFIKIFINKHRKKSLITVFLLSIIFAMAANSPLFDGQAGNLFNNFELKLFAVNYWGNVGKSIFLFNYTKLYFLLVVILILIWKAKDFFNILVSVPLSLISLALYIYSFTIITPQYLYAFFAFIVTIILITFGLFELFFKKHKQLNKTLLVLSFLLLPILIPMIRQPNVVMGNDHRYLIHNAIVIPLLVAFALKTKNKLKKIIVFVISLFFIYTFAESTFSQLHLQQKTHGVKLTKSVWSKIKNQISNEDYYSSDNFIVVTNPEAMTYVGSSVYFGGSFHLAILYDNYPKDVLKLKPMYVVTNVTEIEKYKTKKSSLIFIDQDPSEYIKNQ